MTTKKQKEISGVVRGVSTWYTGIGQLVERLPGVTLYGSGGMVDHSLEPHQCPLTGT